MECGQFEEYGIELAYMHDELMRVGGVDRNTKLSITEIYSFLLS
jgi:hypothetical protein